MGDTQLTDLEIKIYGATEEAIWVDKVLQKIVFEEFKPGESQEFEFSWISDISGSFTISAQVDTSNIINEENEENNADTKTVNISAKKNPINNLIIISLLIFIPSIAYIIWRTRKS
jgi:hypothetical protein